MADGSHANSSAQGARRLPEVFPARPTRIAVVISTVTPYLRPLFDRIAEREDVELLLVTETPVERDRRWQPETDLPGEHVPLDSWTLDLAWMAVGSGFKTRFDSYLYVPKRPVAPLRRFSPDVVVAAGGGVWASPANIAALAARRRHGWAVVPWWNTFSRPRQSLPRQVAEPWVRYFFRSGDAWLAGGSRHARDVVRLGADPERTVVAHMTALAPDPPSTRDGFLVPDQPRYLFVGRFIERKGIDLLLAAFRRLDRGELWLAGDGPLRGFVEEEAKADPRIRYLGYADEAMLPGVYREADVLVVPSLFEPWGLVVHEGLAYGLPVITTDQVGAADDLIESGVNGYIVAPGSSDALVAAMRAVEEWTPAQWQAAAAKNRETLPKYGFDPAADAFVRGCLLGLRHRRALAGSGVTG